MKQKINIRLAVIAIVAVLTTTLVITFVYYRLFQRQVRNDLRVDAKILMDTGVFTEPDVFLMQQNAGKLFSDVTTERLRITWVDEDGTVLYDNDMDAASLENHKDRPEILEAFESGEGESVRRSDTLDMNTFYYAHRLENGTVIRVATEARNIASVFFAVCPLLLLIVLLIIILCVWISHVLTKQLIAPIERMAEHLEDAAVEPVYKELIPFASKIRSQHDHILAAAKMRQDFTANVSHELKTPLTSINGYAELISLQSQGDISYFAGQIQKNATHLVSIINDIIRLSELDHKELVHPGEYLDLLSVAQEVKQAVDVNARARGVSLSVLGEPCSVYGNREMLTELVMNLVQNAIWYNREGGYVRVTVQKQQQHTALLVEDNGIGIPEDARDRVFERFYRVDKSRSRETGGTGLGLSIVKHIAELHEAKISLTGEEGKGTTVKVIF